MVPIFKTRTLKRINSIHGGYLVLPEPIGNTAIWDTSIKVPQTWGLEIKTAATIQTWRKASQAFLQARVSEGSFIAAE